MPQGQSVSNDLQSSSIECIELDQVHVLHESIRSHSCPCFATNLRCSALEWKPLPRTPTSEHAAQWWPKGSSWRPHRQVREDRGNESPRRLRRPTLNNWGSIFVILCVWDCSDEQMKQGARVVTSSWHVQALRDVANAPPGRISCGAPDWPFVATQTLARWAQDRPPSPLPHPV